MSRPLNSDYLEPSPTPNHDNSGDLFGMETLDYTSSPHQTLEAQFTGSVKENDNPNPDTTEGVPELNGYFRSNHPAQNH